MEMSANYEVETLDEGATRRGKVTFIMLAKQKYSLNIK